MTHHHESYMIINMGGVIAINPFAANQCLHRPAMKCTTEPQSHTRAAALPNAACKIDVEVAAARLYFASLFQHI